MIYIYCLDAALAFVASIGSRVDIAVMRVPSLLSIVVVLPTRRPSPLICPCPSIAVAPRCPSPLSRHRAVHRHRRCACAVPHRPSPLRSCDAVPCCQVTVVPSIAVTPCRPSPPSPSLSLSRRQSTSRLPLPLRLPLPSRLPSPLPPQTLRHGRALRCRRIAIAPSNVSRCRRVIHHRCRCAAVDGLFRSRR